ncbi:unnamed protein product [marine sediment metagenome]|uniref:Uncharacterized protein n=1 Tax=marine sediment metagenome TaxID=412755 RepID=X1GCY2_9ZZZZ
MSVIQDYHLMFPDLSSNTLEIIRHIVTEQGLWRVGKEEGFDLIRDMYGKISSVYGFPTPSLIEDTYEYYFISGERIGLPKVSLVSSLHEYRHHMQKHGRLRFGDVEVDARGWSISAFHYALPEDFDSSWSRGLIWYLPPHPGGE